MNTERVSYITEEIELIFSEKEYKTVTFAADNANQDVDDWLKNVIYEAVDAYDGANSLLWKDSLEKTIEEVRKG
jgi:hypothetical protein